MTVASYTFAQARDFMYQTFFTPWMDPTAGWPSILTTIPVTDPPDPGAPIVIWDDEEPADDTPVTNVEVYVVVRHATGQQASLRGETGRRWRRTGVMTMRMRFPPTMQLNTADALSKVVNDAFQGQRGIGDGYGIWFHRVRLVEAGRNQGRYRSDILAYFEYDEIS